MPNRFLWGAGELNCHQQPKNPFTSRAQSYRPSEKHLTVEDGMGDLFNRSREVLASSIAAAPLIDCAPLQADRWIVSSLLQKAIRRGEADLAQRAALSFLAAQGAAIWRRFLVIAVEDVGVGCADTLVKTVAACTDAEWRKEVGGAAAVAAYVARLLADSPKDRSADFLICAAKDHPGLETARERCGSRSVPDRIAMLAEGNPPLPERAVAAWYASGIEWGDETRVGKGDLAGLLAMFRKLGVPDEIATAAGVAAVRTREPLCVMVPLIWLAAHEGMPDVVTAPVPAAPTVNGVPLYALDLHTRLGKQALQRFARENVAVCSCLERWVPEYRWHKVAYVAGFYADGAPVARRLNWSQSRAVETLGIDNDMRLVGVPPEGIAPLLSAFQDNLDHLNELRQTLFERACLEQGN